MKRNTRVLYRFIQSSTPKELAVTYSPAVPYGDHVLVAECIYDNEARDRVYFGAVYVYCTEDHEIDAPVRLIEVSKESFDDAGHALEWGIHLAKLLDDVVAAFSASKEG